MTPAGTFSYGYDAAQRPTSITNPFGEMTSWSYLNNNWLTGQTLSNGATTNYTYNALARLTQLVNKDGSGNILSNFSAMTYDGVGNRTSLTATISSNTPYSGTTSYSYDNKDELTSETSTRSGGYTNTFGYDGAENPTTFRGVASQTFNNDNQRTGTGFAYDGDGNPTTYKGTALSFDVNDRLTAVGSTLTAGYGADGLRSWKTDSTGTNYYLYDGDSVDPVCEMNSSGTVVATNTFGITGLISRNTSSGSTFYAFDQQGTVAERLNSAGSCTSSSTSDAFGVVANSGSVSDPYGYEAQAGYYTDQSTGLCLTTFRYYDPGAGRFLNRDPIGFAGGVNLFAYCGNDAAGSIDDNGTKGAGNGISWGDCVYRRHKFDDDDNKGQPHWDLQGTKLWIGNDGYARSPAGLVKIKNKNTLREIQQGVDDWEDENPGRESFPPQPNKIIAHVPRPIYDPPLRYDPTPVIIIMICVPILRVFGLRETVVVGGGCVAKRVVNGALAGAH